MGGLDGASKDERQRGGYVKRDGGVGEEKRNKLRMRMMAGRSWHCAIYSVVAPRRTGAHSQAYATRFSGETTGVSRHLAAFWQRSTFLGFSVCFIRRSRCNPKNKTLLNGRGHAIPKPKAHV